MYCARCDMSLFVLLCSSEKKEVKKVLSSLDKREILRIKIKQRMKELKMPGKVVAWRMKVSYPNWYKLIRKMRSVDFIMELEEILDIELFRYDQ